MTDHVGSRHSEPDGGAPLDDVPLCTRCLQPHSPDDYYCKNCGAAVGQFTAYIPFVDIPFLANFYGRLWERTWREPGVALRKRAFCLFLVVLMAPMMLVGLPFVVFGRRKPK